MKSLWEKDGWMNGQLDKLMVEETRCPWPWPHHTFLKVISFMLDDGTRASRQWFCLLASDVKAGLHHEAGLAESNVVLELRCGPSQNLQVLLGVPIQVLVHTNC